MTRRDVFPKPRPGLPQTVCSVSQDPGLARCPQGPFARQGQSRRDSPPALASRGGGGILAHAPSRSSSLPFSPRPSPVPQNPSLCPCASLNITPVLLRTSAGHFWFLHGDLWTPRPGVFWGGADSRRQPLPLQPGTLVHGTQPGAGPTACSAISRREFKCWTLAQGPGAPGRS